MTLFRCSYRMSAQVLVDSMNVSGGGLTYLRRRLLPATTAAVTGAAATDPARAARNYSGLSLAVQQRSFAVTRHHVRSCAS